MKTFNARCQPSLDPNLSRLSGARKWAAALSMIAVSGLAASCASAEEPAQEGLRLVLAEAKSCTGVPQLAGLPEEAKAVVVRVYSADTEVVERFTDLEDQREVILTGIAPGDYSIDVALCDEVDRAIWLGTTDGLTVEANTKSFPDVLLTPLGRTGCLLEAPTGTPTTGAFASTVVDDDGVYVVGGIANASSVNGTIELFDTNRGGVTPVGELVHPRFGAHADLLADGRLRVIGGAASLYVFNATPILEPTSVPACAVEVFDPASGQSTCTDDTVLPAWPAMAMVGGAVVAVGGWENKAPSNQISVFPQAGPALVDSMATARLQPVSVAFGNYVFVLGGITANQPGDTMAELIDLSGGLVSVAPMTSNTAPSAFPHFAAAAYTGMVDDLHTAIVIGGNDFTPNPGGSPVFDVEASSNIYLVSIDVEAKTFTMVPLDAGANKLMFQRSAAQIVALADGSFVLGGGISAITIPTVDCEGAEMPGQCFRQSVVRFRVDPAQATLSVVDSADMTVGTLGASMGVLKDGAILITGGLDTVSEWGASLESELLRFPGPLDALCASP